MPQLPDTVGFHSVLTLQDDIKDKWFPPSERDRCSSRLCQETREFSLWGGEDILPGKIELENEQDLEEWRGSGHCRQRKGRQNSRGYRLTIPTGVVPGNSLQRQGRPSLTEGWPLRDTVHMSYGDSQEVWSDTSICFTNMAQALKR